MFPVYRHYRKYYKKKSKKCPGDQTKSTTRNHRWSLWTEKDFWWKSCEQTEDKYKRKTVELTKHLKTELSTYNILHASFFYEQQLEDFSIFPNVKIIVQSEGVKKK